MFVRDIMQRHLETITSTASIQDAAGRMRDASVGFLPVVESGKLIGVVTDRDLVVRALARGLDPKTRVREVRTEEAVACGPADNLAAARAMMERNLIRRLVVVDDYRTPIGIITLDDLARVPGAVGEAHTLIEHLARPKNLA